MKLVVFGLTISSSWGNRHAGLWRGLCRALVARGHTVTFFERDTPYYAEHRDYTAIPGGNLVLYSGWTDIQAHAQRELSDADVGMVTSYCPDALVASELVLSSPAKLKTFYDLDTPVTLHALESGEEVPYVPHNGLGDFDLVLSYTGGVALSELQSRLHARAVAPLYGHVDPEVHRPVPATAAYRCDLSHLGTYAADRQPMLDLLFIDTARRMPGKRFLIGGAQYPPYFSWTENVFLVRDVPPPDHAAFFCSSRLTLNVTRQAMAGMGYCPSGRLFEAAACGAPVLSDWWPGLDTFFSPGKEIVIAHSTDEAIAAMSLSDAELKRIAAAARERTLAEHTSLQRVIHLEKVIGDAMAGSRAPGLTVPDCSDTESDVPGAKQPLEV